MLGSVEEEVLGSVELEGLAQEAQQVSLTSPLTSTTPPMNVSIVAAQVENIRRTAAKAAESEKSLLTMRLAATVLGMRNRSVARAKSVEHTGPHPSTHQLAAVRC